MKLENLYCHRCGEKLTQLESDDIFSDGNVTYHCFRCENCGAEYEVYEPGDDEKKKYDFWKNEDISSRVGTEGDHIMNDICLNCGGKVFVVNNFMLSDYEETEFSEGDDKMNYLLNACPKCGCAETRWDNSENEKRDLPYWKDDCD